MAKEDYRGIWVFAEQQNGELNHTVLEILAKAQELKAHTGEEVSAVLLGDGVSGLAGTLFAYGADQLAATRLIRSLREKGFIRIHIDENCIVGWATSFYRDVEMFAIYLR